MRGGLVGTIFGPEHIDLCCLHARDGRHFFPRFLHKNFY